jgi:hypothetical protein
MATIAVATRGGVIFRDFPIRDKTATSHDDGAAGPCPTVREMAALRRNPNAHIQRDYSSVSRLEIDAAAASYIMSRLPRLT